MTPIACPQRREVTSSRQQPYQNLSKSLYSLINIRNQEISSPNNSNLILPRDNLPSIAKDKDFELYEVYL